MWEQVQALPTPQTVRAQRTLRVEHAFWLPPADPDGDMKDRAAEVSLEEQTVIIRPAFLPLGPEVTFSAAEFLAVVAFLVDEGILEACGIHPKARTTPHDVQIVPLVETEPATDRALLDDPVWLRARYVDDGLTLAEIGRMCGVHAQTVSKRLKAAGIQVQRGRHRSPAPDADPPVEDPPEGQAD